MVKLTLELVSWFLKRAESFKISGTHSPKLQLRQAKSEIRFQLDLILTFGQIFCWSYYVK